MITRVSANNTSFKKVEFTKGFNVVLADSKKESRKKDSRNGLGKSTLLEILHFCLGAKAITGKGLNIKALEGWDFSLEMLIGGRHIKVTRSIDHPKTVSVEGNISSLLRNNNDRKSILLTELGRYEIKDWNSLLGHLYFGLPFKDDMGKYQPTFRSLISYFIRRHKDAFSTPFEYHRKQREWEKQVNNAFLLNLSWEDAAEIQKLKDRRKGMDDFRKAVKAGFVKGYSGSIGDLEAKKTRLKAKADKETKNLQTFKVHPHYQQLQTDANRLTMEIHDEVNANCIDNLLLAQYEESLSDEQPPSSDNIVRLYKDASISLPGITLRRLEDVQSFHRSILENRRSFLAYEVEHLKLKIAKRDEAIKNKTNDRSSMMVILEKHGALEEYTLLQEQHMKTVTEVNEITSTIENMKSLETCRSEAIVEQERLQQKARRDYDERLQIRERSITLFNSYSEHLYQAPGKLILDVSPKGFNYDIEIERSGSAGINNMKVFCYDLMLARLWAELSPSPQLLIHDSTIFDGVDERQRALALELAAEEAETYGFQYICTLNSDYVPSNKFSRDFDFDKFIKLRLTDESVDGCLLGIRF